METIAYLRGPEGLLNVGPTLKVGRNSKAHIYLNSQSCDQKHAVIKYDSFNKKYFVEDLGSVNGTYKNDMRIAKPLPLEDHDVLRFGYDKASYRFELVPKKTAPNETKQRRPKSGRKSSQQKQYYNLPHSEENDHGSVDYSDKQHPSPSFNRRTQTRNRRVRMDSAYVHTREESPDSDDSLEPVEDTTSRKAGFKQFKPRPPSQEPPARHAIRSKVITQKNRHLNGGNREAQRYSTGGRTKSQNEPISKKPVAFDIMWSEEGNDDGVVQQESPIPSAFHIKQGEETSYKSPSSSQALENGLLAEDNDVRASTRSYLDSRATRRLSVVDENLHNQQEYETLNITLQASEQRCALLSSELTLRERKIEELEMSLLSARELNGKVVEQHKEKSRRHPGHSVSIQTINIEQEESSKYEVEMMQQVLRDSEEKYNKLMQSALQTDKKAKILANRIETLTSENLQLKGQIEQINQEQETNTEHLQFELEETKQKLLEAMEHLDERSQQRSVRHQGVQTTQLTNHMKEEIDLMKQEHEAQLRQLQFELEEVKQELKKANDLNATFEHREFKAIQDSSLKDQLEQTKHEHEKSMGVMRTELEGTKRKLFQAMQRLKEKQEVKAVENQEVQTIEFEPTTSNQASQIAMEQKNADKVLHELNVCITQMNIPPFNAQPFESYDKRITQCLQNINRVSIVLTKTKLKETQSKEELVSVTEKLRRDTQAWKASEAKLKTECKVKDALISSNESRIEQLESDRDRLKKTISRLTTTEDWSAVHVALRKRKLQTNKTHPNNGNG
eukprot:m.33180 g.33180  ORF g.33180 m.33180 type:complete len:789 (+) comp8505_c0_seq1:120-2486(+)